ncbi:MAG: hypothetical protein H0T46_11240 [Deltaproteobacteria bacterium]|nr:hypothetical protein [Deltaproteobacteria bacterium]
MLSTISLSWYAWRIRTRLDKAEYYVQSGVESVFYICSPVLRALNGRGEYAPTEAVFDIARECIGQVDRSEVEAVSDAVRQKNVAAVTKRLQAKLDARDLPYRAVFGVKNEWLPIGYRE